MTDQLDLEIRYNKDPIMVMVMVSGDLSATTGPSCSVSRSSPVVWGQKGKHLSQSTDLLLSQLLMPALQARRLCHALVLQVRVAHGEELVGGGTRHRVHEDREVARLRQSSLAAVAHAQCQHRADAVVVRAEEMFKVCASASTKAFQDTWSKFVQEHEAL